MEFPKHIFFPINNTYAVLVDVLDMCVTYESSVLCIVLKCLCIYELMPISRKCLLVTFETTDSLQPLLFKEQTIRLSWHKQIESLNNRGRVVTVHNSINILYVHVIRMAVNILQSDVVSSKRAQT
jgi:hypothetical protein